MPVARPHKYLDAASLEEWIGKHHPQIFGDWELSEAAEWIDFWDWLLESEHYELFYDFEEWFLREG